LTEKLITHSEESYRLLASSLVRSMDLKKRRSGPDLDYGTTRGKDLVCKSRECLLWFESRMA